MQHQACRKGGVRMSLDMHYMRDDGVPDSSEAEALAQRLRHAEVAIVLK